MTLYNKIIEIYPTLDLSNFIAPNQTIFLQNDSDGKGDYIAKWEHPTLTRPTDDVLYENTSLTSLNRELA